MLVALINVLVVEDCYEAPEISFEKVIGEDFIEITEEEYELCKYNLPKGKALINISPKEDLEITLKKLIEKNRKEKENREKDRKKYEELQKERERKKKEKAILKAKKLLEAEGIA